jgi:hypothetical protein
MRETRGPPVSEGLGTPSPVQPSSLVSCRFREAVGGYIAYSVMCTIAKACGQRRVVQQLCEW